MQVRLKQWPWIHSLLPRGRLCGGGKSTVVQKLVLCLGKHKNFQKQMPPPYRKVSILIFHMERHFLWNNTASVLHTVSTIFCSPSSHVPANPAVSAPNHSSLCWPAEATRAARHSPWGRKPSRGSRAVQSRASWDSLGDRGCQGLEQTAFGWLCADGSRPGSQCQQ